MEHHERFKQALIRMLQAGEFHKLLGCRPGQCAKVEFQLTRVFHIHLTRQYTVLHEWEREAVRRHTNGRWRLLRPARFPRDRIVMDRASGTIVSTQRLGRLIRTPRPAYRRAIST